MAKLSGWWSGLKRRFARLTAPRGSAAAAVALAVGAPLLRLPSPALRLRLPPPSEPRRKRVSLALQGGGAHGAFTWGVLDRLLADDRLEIVAVSGASAGAMNAAMLAQGLGRGGAVGAQEQLETFWRKVSAAGASGMIVPGLIDRLSGNWNLDNSPSTHLYEYIRRWVSPYDVQPQAYHPLRRLLEETLDVAAIKASGVELYVSATDVGSGGLKIFRGAEIGVDALLASACLPHLFQAVRIDGRDYWDGGYLANPALFPLIESHADADLILVTINPFSCPDLPKRPAAINARLAQISMNAPLQRELDDIRAGRLKGAGAVRLHHIRAEDVLPDLGHYSKLTADWDFLRRLRDAGRIAADRLPADSFDAPGVAA
jgi:NTE family protein